MEAAKEDVSLSAFEERNSIQALIDKLPFTDPINAEEYLCLEEEEEEEAFLINSITDIVRMILGEKRGSDEEEEKEVKKRVLSKKPAEVLRLCCNFSSNKITILS